MKVNKFLTYLFFTLFIVISCEKEDDTTPLDSLTETPLSDVPSDAIFIADITALEAIIKTASGGEFIVLKNGDYGTLTIDTNFSNTVTIKAENTLEATFDALIIEESNNLVIDGLFINDNIEGSYSSNNTIKNSKLSAAIFKFATAIIFTNNDLNYANFNDSSYFEVTNNYIHHASADLLHVKGNAHHFSIENNIFFDTIPDEDAHSDALQMAGNSNGTPHDFVLRGNYLYDDPTTDVANGKIKKLQGFFIADANGLGYYNVRIEENIVNVSNTSNSIAVLGAGENVTISNNTLLPTSVGSGGGIRVTMHEESATANNIIVAKNIASIPQYGNVNGILEDDNIFYGSNSIDLNTLFENPTIYGSWKIFIPKENSSVDFGSGYGAEKRIQEMLNGENLHQSQKE